MTEPRQVIRRRQTAGSGADDQHFFPRLFSRALVLPAVLQRQVTKKPLDCVNADGAVGKGPIADVFTRVIADSSVNRGQRVVPHEFLPGGLVLPFLRQCQPGLDILTGRARIVARRKKIDINRPPGAQRTRALVVPGQVRACRQVFGGHFICA